MRFPRGSFEDGTGHRRRQTCGRISADNGLQLQCLTNANEFYLPSVLFQLGSFRGIVEHLGERATIQHVLKDGDFHGEIETEEGKEMRGRFQLFVSKSITLQSSVSGVERAYQFRVVHVFLVQVLD